MSKTPEELAEEYATPKFERYDETSGYQKAKKYAFLEGYKAAQEHAHAALKKAGARIQKLRDQLMEESGGRLKLFKDDADAKAAYQEALEKTDSWDHIVDASKMVDVNFSNNSNGWISVKDRLPEKNSKMLLLMCVDGYELGYYERYKGLGWTNVLGTDCLNVTHWQEIPEPLKEEG